MQLATSIANFELIQEVIREWNSFRSESNAVHFQTSSNRGSVKLEILCRE